MSLILNAVVCAAFIFMSSDYESARWGAWICTALLALQAARFRCLSQTDALTGLHNLHHLAAVKRSYRHCREIGVWYFDVDHLKQVNDTQGHRAGDLLLQEFAGSLRTVSSPGAKAYRIGGDEFLLIVPQPSGDSVPPLPDAFELPASWGYANGPGPRLSELILRAEQEMYRSRRIAEAE